MLRAEGLIVNDSPAVADALALSVTLTVKFDDPAVLGVPDMTPPGDSVNPAGNDPPDIDHEYGALPPDALSPCE